MDKPSQTTNHETSWPYSERNSVNVEQYVQELLASPERPLDESELQYVREFSSDVYQGNTISGVECKAGRNLETLLAVSVLKDIQTFDLAYFRTPGGIHDLEALGLKSDATDEEIVQCLYNTEMVDETLGKKGRKEIATRTSDWRRDMITERLADPSENDVDYEPEKSVTVAFKPTDLLDKLQDLHAHRIYVRQILHDLKTEPQTDMRDAKITTTEVLLARVNNMAAELYPATVSLAKQLDKSPRSEASQALIEQLVDAAPFLSQAFKEDETYDSDRRSAFLDQWQNQGLRRIDFVSNGVGYTEGGSITPVDAGLIAWADNYRPGEVDPTAERVFSDEELAVMEETVWNADQTKMYGEAILSDWDLLSSYQSTWEEADERNGPAPDNKWQIVTTPHKKSLAVNGPKKVVFIPEKMQRAIVQPAEAGIISLLAHESTHVLQNEFDQILAEQVPSAAIKGRRNVTMRELGGVMEETEVQVASGKARSTNLHYLRALQTKETGGNPLQVARAFFDSLCPDPDSISEAQLIRLRKQAADRSRRFYRAGGHNTQPLDYVEQGYISQLLSRLPETERKALAVAGTSFALSDAAALHKYGLLELPKTIDRDPAETAIRIFRRDYLPQLMAA
jgi:hypothetical protein